MKTFVIILTLIVSGSVYAAINTPPVVITRVAKLSDLSEEITYPARIESKVNASVISESEGVVARILAPLGTTVRKNQKIVVIKHTDPVYQYAPVVLVSPVEGVVSQVNVTEGSGVTKNEVIVTITNPKQLRTVIEVAAADLPLVKKGLTGELAFKGKDSAAVKVIGISPYVDLVTGTATCELEMVDKKGNVIAPGSVGQVTFKVNAHRSFVLPDHAIVYRGSETFVRLLQNGVAKKVPITIGKRNRGNVEIVSGLKDGDVVIERANKYVADGDKVEVQRDGAVD